MKWMWRIFLGLAAFIALPTIAVVIVLVKYGDGLAGMLQSTIMNSSEQEVVQTFTETQQELEGVIEEVPVAEATEAYKAMLAERDAALRKISEEMQNQLFITTEDYGEETAAE